MTMQIAWAVSMVIFGGNGEGGESHDGCLLPFGHAKGPLLPAGLRVRVRWRCLCADVVPEVVSGMAAPREVAWLPPLRGDSLEQRRALRRGG